MKSAKPVNHTQHDPSARDEKGATVIDPVCGMTVKPESAAGTYEYNGQSYYFCSTHCLNRFREDPVRFLNKSTESMASQPVVIQRETKPAGVMLESWV